MAILKDRLRADRVAAMKARDVVAKDTLAMALTAIQLEEVSGDVARELSDDEVIAVLTREVAKRKDSAEAYAAGHRQDLVDSELAEAQVRSAVSDETPVPKLSRASLTPNRRRAWSERRVPAWRSLRVSSSMSRVS